LSYAKDLAVADKINVPEIIPTAMVFYRWLETGENPIEGKVVSPPQEKKQPKIEPLQAKPEEVEEIDTSWNTIRVTISGLMNSKKVSVDSLLKELENLGAKKGTNLKGTYETLDDNKQRVFIKLLNKY